MDFRLVSAFPFNAEEECVTGSTARYRSYHLRATHGLLRWSVAIIPIKTDLPDMPLAMQVLRGWDRNEVISSAKSRIDNLLTSWSVLSGRKPSRANLRLVTEAKRKVDQAGTFAGMAACENEGRALEPLAQPEALCASGDRKEILIHLGSSVASHRDSFPVRLKRATFRDLAAKDIEPKADLKERTARYLHTGNRHLSTGNSVSNEEKHD
jgi:hypothetical protein